MSNQIENLDINNALRKEKYQYIFKCANIDCSNEVKSKPYYLKKHSGKCVVCSHRKNKYEHLYNKVKSSSRNENKSFSLTYEEFSVLCKHTSCHYCKNERIIDPYCYSKGKYTSSMYGLDRKDNNLGYSISNCVPCCTKCNIAKGNRYSYDEWYGMTKYFRDINNV